MLSIEVSPCYVQTIVSRETSKMFRRVLCNFCFHNQNNSTSSLGLLGEQCINLQMCCTFDITGWFIAKFFQICSTIAAYAELCVCFQPAYRYILGNQNIKHFFYLLSSHLLRGRFKSKLYESGTSTIALSNAGFCCSFDKHCTKGYVFKLIQLCLLSQSADLDESGVGDDNEVCTSIVH